jgi:hypothetical protein
MDQVTSAAGNRFESSGWDIIRGFLDPSELALIAATLEEVRVLPRPSCMRRPGNDLIPLRWRDAVVARFLGARRRVQRLRDLLRAPDLKWLSGYVSTKAPHSPALWWHQDWWCWDHPISFARSAAQVAVLCYLSDTSERNGALRVLPGSHHKSTAIHAQLPEPHGEYANGLPLDHPAMRDSPDQITVPVQAGDAVVLDYRLLHGTHANETSDRRDCVLLSFIPNWRGLSVDLKAHLIAHPALPDASETAHPAVGYADLLPRFAGTSAPLRINRLPPPTFNVQ